MRWAEQDQIIVCREIFFVWCGQTNYDDVKEGGSKCSRDHDAAEVARKDTSNVISQIILY